MVTTEFGRTARRQRRRRHRPRHRLRDAGARRPRARRPRARPLAGALAAASSTRTATSPPPRTSATCSRRWRAPSSASPRRSSPATRRGRESASSEARTAGKDPDREPPASPCAALARAPGPRARGRPAAAGERHGTDLFAGYSFAKIDDVEPPRRQPGRSASTSSARSPASSTRAPTGAASEGVSLNDLTLMAGPGVRFGKRGGTVFFVRALAGLVQDKASISVLDVDISESRRAASACWPAAASTSASTKTLAVRAAGRLPLERRHGGLPPPAGTLRRRRLVERLPRLGRHRLPLRERAVKTTRRVFVVTTGATVAGHAHRLRRGRLVAELAHRATPTPPPITGELRVPLMGVGETVDRVRQPRGRPADAARRHARVADRGGRRLAHLHPRGLHRRPADARRARRSTARATARASGRPARW